MDQVVVAGKTEPVRIYELMALAGELGPEQVRLRDTYAEGLAAYRRQDWAAARQAFAICLEIEADDGPSRLLLERTGQLQASPPAADWDGVWHHLEK